MWPTEVQLGHGDGPTASAACRAGGAVRPREFAPPPSSGDGADLRVAGCRPAASRHPVPTQFEATLYEPVVCVVLRGRKETTFGEHTFDVAPATACWSATTCPSSRASRGRRTWRLLDVSLDTLRGLYDEVGPSLPTRPPRWRSRCTRRRGRSSTRWRATWRSPSPRPMPGCSARWWQRRSTTACSRRRLAACCAA